MYHPVYVPLTLILATAVLGLLVRLRDSYNQGFWEGYDRGFEERGELREAVPFTNVKLCHPLDFPVDGPHVI